MKKNELEKLNAFLVERNRCLEVGLNALRDRYNLLKALPYSETKKALIASEKKLNTLRDEIKSLIPRNIELTGEGYLEYLRNAVRDNESFANLCATLDAIKTASGDTLDGKPHRIEEHIAMIRSRLDELEQKNKAAA